MVKNIGRKAEACNFIKKKLKDGCFSVNIAKFLRAPFSEQQLLLHIESTNQLNGFYKIRNTSG